MTLVSLALINFVLLDWLSSIKATRKRSCVIDLKNRGRLNAEDTSTAVLMLTAAVQRRPSLLLDVRKTGRPQFIHILQTSIPLVQRRDHAKRAGRSIGLDSSSESHKQQALWCLQWAWAKAEVSGVESSALIIMLVLVPLWQMHIFLHRSLRWAANAC